MHVLNNTINVQVEVDGYFTDLFSVLPLLDDVFLFLVGQAEGVGSCQSFSLVPTAWANKPMQACVVFMPAVGADGWYFVVHRLNFNSHSIETGVAISRTLNYSMELMADPLVGVFRWVEE